MRCVPFSHNTQLVGKSFAGECKSTYVDPGLDRESFGEQQLKLAVEVASRVAHAIDAVPVAARFVGSISHKAWPYILNVVY